MTILLTGATGYVGGRLLMGLQEDGLSVRCLARDPDRLLSLLAGGSHAVRGDLLDAPSLGAALQGVTDAYYLVHSMAASRDFVERDREGARNFAAAAKAAGIRRIIYLGGLGSGTNLSPHLASRHEVGRILRDSAVPTIEFRGAIIIGSGSLSFEMIRALVDRLPVMITPRWVGIKTQPIAIEDVVTYLRSALDSPSDTSGVFEIGGAERVTYGDLMLEYAHQRGLRRLMLSVPLLTPRLSSLWLGLVTPLYARVGRQLIESLRHETIVRDDSARTVFHVVPMGMKDAIARALANEDQEFAATRWSDAMSSAASNGGWGGVKYGSRLVDSRVATVGRPPDLAFVPIERIGGKTGWYYGDLLWRLRGWLDLMVGGAGLRRGRRDPDHLRVGDHVDFWRVEQIEPGRLLRLGSEMKLPGRAWLQFEAEPGGDGSTTIRQTALFDPVGVAGLAYWYALWPLHNLVFGNMIRKIASAAGKGPGSSSKPPGTTP